MKWKSLILVFLLTILLSSCGLNEATNQKSSQVDNETPQSTQNEIEIPQSVQSENDNDNLAIDSQPQEKDDEIESENHKIYNEIIYDALKDGYTVDFNRDGIEETLFYKDGVVSIFNNNEKIHDFEINTSLRPISLEIYVDNNRNLFFCVRVAQKHHVQTYNQYISLYSWDGETMILIEEIEYQLDHNTLDEPLVTQGKSMEELGYTLVDILVMID